MNDKQILELVAKTPKISATELSGYLNAELRDVSNALRSLVDVGDLVKSIRFGEQGRQCQVYELSEEFRSSRDGKELLVRIGNEAVPVQAGTPEPAEIIEEVKLSPAASHAWAAEMSKAPADPKREPAIQSITKAGRAVAYLHAHGTATGEQLRIAMELVSTAYVTTYLAKAIKNGLLHKVDGVWHLGPLPAEQTDNVEVVGNVIIATRDQAPVPPEVKAAVVEMASAAVTELRKPEPAPAAAAPPKATERDYSCAIWLSGKVEIRKAGGRVVITLAELAEIVAFAAERRIA